MSIRLNKFQINNMTGEYAVHLYNGCIINFSNLKDTNKFLVKVSKDLNASYVTMNDVYRQVIFASQPYIFLLGKHQHKYMKLKSFIDERLWFTLNLYGGQSNHFYIHVLIVIAGWLGDIMILVSSSCKQKNVVLEETFKTARTIIEAEVFKIRTTYKITELTTQRTEEEFHALYSSLAITA